MKCEHATTHSQREEGLRSQTLRTYTLTDAHVSFPHLLLGEPLLDLLVITDVINDGLRKL